MAPYRYPYPEDPSPALARLLHLTGEILELVRAGEWDEEETEAVAVQIYYLSIKLQIAEQDLKAAAGVDEWAAWTFVDDHAPDLGDGDHHRISSGRTVTSSSCSSSP